MPRARVDEMQPRRPLCARCLEADPELWDRGIDFFFMLSPNEVLKPGILLVIGVLIDERS